METSGEYQYQTNIPYLENAESAIAKETSQKKKIQQHCKRASIAPYQSYDFVSDRTANGQKLKILVVVDEHTRECLALEVAVSIRSHHLIDTLSRLMTLHGKPRFIRSDNGPEFTANALIRWLIENHIGPAFIKPRSPWQNSYVESFNGKFRDECLSREWFLNRKEAQVIIEKWRYSYNYERPHSSLNNQPPSKVSGRPYAT